MAATSFGYHCVTRHIGAALHICPPDTAFDVRVYHNDFILSAEPYLKLCKNNYRFSGSIDNVYCCFAKKRYHLCGYYFINKKLEYDQKHHILTLHTSPRHREEEPQMTLIGKSKFT